MFLQLPEKETRPSVLGTAQTYLRFLLPPEVRRTFEKSSFTMSEIIDGERVSIYMILPPDKLMSHASILKVWVGVLFRAITSRRTIPANRTVFMLDECAQLGHFPYLESVITLCRGFGLQVWSFWQDLSQIRTNYERSWETMLNNCVVLQIFGARNYMVANEFAAITGTTSDEIRRTEVDQQVIVVRGGDPARSSRLNYLTDQPFRRLADPNPLYSSGERNHGAKSSSSGREKQTGSSGTVVV
jgi:type IV secretion system protein VirD4